MNIPEARFYLKEPNASEPTLISMQAKYEGQRVFMSTGNKVHPKEWNSVKQRAIVSRANLVNGEINIWLDKMATEFKSVFRNCMIDGVFPDAQLVMRKIQENLNLVTKPKEIKVTLLDFIRKYIEDCKNSKAPNTIKSYKGTLNHLNQFGELQGRTFDFKDITFDWRVSFIKYLQSQGFGRNTEGKHIKNIKLFMNEANERGLHDNTDYRSKRFHKPIEDIHKPFLVKSEIEALYNQQFENGSLKEIVRDYFIISCLTALRYSDLVDIKEEHIKENVLELITKKTGEEVVIPIAPMVRKILEKYNYSLPKAPCNQVFNKVLKEVGKQAELNETITITKTVGGIKKTISYKKYQLLTCHTGRRTMISNSILAGLPTSSIMLISAHKSFRVFNSYVRINQRQNADALSKHSFFN
jgi:site-specific recombinase XerD